MLCPICKKELSCVISMYSCKECNLFCNRETIDILAKNQKDHKKPRSTNIALRQRIAVLEQNNNVLRYKCEEYLGKLAVAKQALDWLGHNHLASNFVRVEQLRQYARNALEQINRKED